MSKLGAIPIYPSGAKLNAQPTAVPCWPPFSSAQKVVSIQLLTPGCWLQKGAWLVARLIVGVSMYFLM